MTVFAKRDHLGQILILSFACDLPLYNALYRASVAGLVSGIYLRECGTTLSRKRRLNIYFWLNPNILCSSVSRNTQLVQW